MIKRYSQRLLVTPAGMPRISLGRLPHFRALGRLKSTGPDWTRECPAALVSVAAIRAGMIKCHSVRCYSRLLSATTVLAVHLERSPATLFNRQSDFEACEAESWQG